MNLNNPKIMTKQMGNCLTSYLILAVMVFMAFSCQSPSDKEIELVSPNGTHTINFRLTEMGNPVYEVTRNGNSIISESKMGLEIKEYSELTNSFKLIGKKNNSVENEWEPVWGQYKTINDHYNELVVYLQETTDENRKLTIYFRAYDDGIAFRYEIKDAQRDSLIVTDELTEFNFISDGDSWWIPAFGDKNYEYLYGKSKLSDFDTLNENQLVHTPFTFKLESGVHASIHEASLVDFPSMTIEMTGKSGMKSFLAPWQNGDKAYVASTFKTPWRTVQLSDNSGGLLESSLILNLNEPNRLEETDWVKPMKYIGIWWGMHINKWTFRPSSRHGATTKNSLQYLEFAKNHGFDALLIEGWNEGWVDKWWKGIPNANFTKPVANFDLDLVYGTAKEYGVSIVVHHETTGYTEGYESNIDTIYQFCQDNDIHYIKTGYVGHNFLNGESRLGQYAVRHYRKVIEKAAEYKINVIAHEAIKPTGESRTFPNMMSRESVRGMEYNGFYTGGNPPNHTLIVPFTRGLAGPIDFTPGIFNILFGGASGKQRVHSTLAKQLALYVTIYSPIQMAADLVENYEGHPALEFIKTVPVDWSETKVINAEIGEYLVMTRKDKHSEDWFLGAITNENSREFEVPLDFLSDGMYEAQLFQDSENTDLELAPTKYEILNITVGKSDTLKLKLTNSGGVAIRFKRSL